MFCCRFVLRLSIGVDYGGRRRPPGVDMGHPADAARHRGPHLGVHGGRGRDQPDPVGRHATRLDRHLLQPLARDPPSVTSPASPSPLLPPHSFVSIFHSHTHTHTHTLAEIRDKVDSLVSVLMPRTEKRILAKYAPAMFSSGGEPSLISAGRPTKTTTLIPFFWRFSLSTIHTHTHTHTVARASTRLSSTRLF